MAIYFDEHGLRLADVANAGVSKVDPNAKSGNPNHDLRSGKFGAGGKGPESDMATAPNTSPEDQLRMNDAIREAAREFDDPEIGDVQEFIRGRAKAPDQVDVQAFLGLVREQRINDLVDILDSQIRKGGSLTRGRRKVRLSAPRGYIRGLMRRVDSDTVAQIFSRLEAMGHDQKDVQDFFNKRFGEEKTTEAQTKRKQQPVAASNWDAEKPFYALDQDDDEDFFDDDRPEPVDPLHMAEKIAQNLPQPVINVTVQAPQTGKKIVRRNPDTGLIESIEEEDASPS